MNLFADNLDQNSFPSFAIELVIENVFPWAEVELAVGDGDDDFSAHDLSFVVGVGVVFSGAVVEVAPLVRVAAGVEGDQFFEPAFVVGVQAGFVVVDEDAGGDVHCINKYDALVNSTLGHEFLYFSMNRNNPTTIGDFHPEFFRHRFHCGRLSKLISSELDRSARLSGVLAYRTVW